MKTKNSCLILFLFNSFSCPLTASTSKKRCINIQNTNQNFLKKQKFELDKDLKELNQTTNKLMFLEKALKNHEILKDSEYSGLYFHEIYDRDEGEYVVVGEKTPAQIDKAIKNLIEHRFEPELKQLREKILMNDTIQRSLKR